jgi:hypothetical protein
MAGSPGNDTISGLIPAYYQLPTPPEALSTASAHNQRIRDWGLRTQNYDKRLDHFVRKFHPEEEMKATMAPLEAITVNAVGRCPSRNIHAVAACSTRPTV